MADFLRGRWPSHKSIPAEITEFFLAKEFSWTLEYIRELPIKDYETLTMLMDLFYKVRYSEQKARMKSGLF